VRLETVSPKALAVYPVINPVESYRVVPNLRRHIHQTVKMLLSLCGQELVSESLTHVVIFGPLQHRRKRRKNSDISAQIFADKTRDNC
jgi:hypothetical protein